MHLEMVVITKHDVIHLGMVVIPMHDRKSTSCGEEFCYYVNMRINITVENSHGRHHFKALKTPLPLFAS